MNYHLLRNSIILAGVFGIAVLPIFLNSFEVDPDDPYQKAVEYFQSENYAEAAPLLRKLSHQRHAGAEHLLFHMYWGGLGVTQDIAEAKRYAGLAAKHGKRRSQTNLDNIISFERTMELARQGDGVAQFSVAVRQLSGKGTHVNPVEAMEWYARSAENGYAPAMFNLADILHRDKSNPLNHGIAMKWFRRAAEDGMARAAINIGLIYANGDGVEKNYVEAADWFDRAAQSGSTNAWLIHFAMKNFGIHLKQSYLPPFKNLMKFEQSQ